jgi:hypothetical protein
MPRLPIADDLRADADDGERAGGADGRVDGRVRARRRVVDPVERLLLEAEQARPAEMSWPEPMCSATIACWSFSHSLLKSVATQFVASPAADQETLPFGLPTYTLFCQTATHVPFGASGSATAVHVIPSGEVKRPSVGWQATTSEFVSANVASSLVVNVFRAVFVVPR